MEKKLIIPCLDVKDGRVVKGIYFENLRDVGDPVEFGKHYEEQGADELVYLDINATVEGRKTFTEIVERIAKEIKIPFTVGGGITSLDDAERLFAVGADKVSINSAAVANPEIINEIAAKHGSKSLVIAIDGVEKDGKWYVTTHGGNKVSDKELIDWAKECEQRGAGSLLFTSKTHDGTKIGYPCDIFAELKKAVSIPIIASGGAGCIEDIVEVLTTGKADAALAASIFHFGEVTIPQLKAELMRRGICVERLPLKYSDFNLSKNSDGLLPCVMQDAATLKVLMVGYMNEEAFNKTLETGKATFYSRERKTLWTKGETSGNFMQVVEMFADCDADTLLLKVVPCGPACHRNTTSCFDTSDAEGFIRRLETVIQGRHKEMPEGHYTTHLFNKGVNRMAQKVGEEAVETVIEAIDGNKERYLYEASDLVYHLLVLNEQMGFTIADMERELLSRHK